LTRQTATRPKHQQAELIRTIGGQMRAARNLCNLSLTQAAKRLGYANPSKLSKVERASDTNSVPLLLILKASKCYEVSIDFLFGITDDWETGARMTQEREVSPWLLDAFEQSRRKDIEALRHINDRIEVMRIATCTMSTAADDVYAAMHRFSELNPQFEDMPGSNRMYTACVRMQAVGGHAKARMRRFGMECKLAAIGNDRQPSLFQ